MVFRSQAGLIGITNDVRPVSCFDSPDTCDHTPSVLQRFPRNYRYGNRNSRTADNAYSLQFINRLEFFLNSKVLGEHHVQLKDNLITQQDNFRRSVAGRLHLRAQRHRPRLPHRILLQRSAGR